MICDAYSVVAFAILFWWLMNYKMFTKNVILTLNKMHEYFNRQTTFNLEKKTRIEQKHTKLTTCQ